jgi:hypothetical protein
VTERPACNCLEPQYTSQSWPALWLHAERQDTACEAWGRLLELIDRAVEDGREELAPGRDLGWEQWAQIVTLPPTIAKLKRVKRLILYGSGLVRVPPEVGEMTALREFDAYTSYRLHWLPYEITRCRRLAESRISTRALYGNYKYRPPFPRLPQMIDVVIPGRCSVCEGPFDRVGPRQCWISLRVATDVLPLLVHACSAECIGKLPAPASGYVQRPHQGGSGVAQPPPK